MNYSILKTILLFGVLGFFIGCSGDRTQLVSHPTAAKPGDTISVIFADAYIIVCDSNVLTTELKRDSLHAVYGLPAGWSVLSSDYYVASGIQMNSVMNIVSDPTLISKLLQDSIATYMAKKTPMSTDITWKNYFTNKTLTAHGFALDSIQVNVNNVSQWLSYAAKISFKYSVGTKMDTSIAVSSLPIDTTNLSSFAKNYIRSYDTIWIKTVPIVCFARIIVGQLEGDFNLYYFTKTGVLPTPSIFPAIPNFDKGDLTYAAININKANAVMQLPSLSRAESLLRVCPGPGSTTRIGIGAHAVGELSICDIAGKTVRRFGLAEKQNPVIVWDQTTSAGAKVNTGVYVVRLQTKEQSAAQTVRIVK
jgi:hypothetical protein